jgi:hypothetical protein
MAVVPLALLLAIAGCKGTAGSDPGGQEYRIGQTIYWVGPDRPSGTQWEPSGKDGNGDTVWKRPVTPADREKGQ